MCIMAHLATKKEFRQHLCIQRLEFHGQSLQMEDISMSGTGLSYRLSIPLHSAAQNVLQIAASQGTGEPEQQHKLQTGSL